MVRENPPSLPPVQKVLVDMKTSDCIKVTMSIRVRQDMYNQGKTKEQLPDQNEESYDCRDCR